MTKRPWYLFSKTGPTVNINPRLLGVLHRRGRHAQADACGKAFLKNIAGALHQIIFGLAFFAA
jgi:hypothetical protein